jgi:hypothetical protein
MTPERFFAALCRLYPRSFRDEYGDEMLVTFREMHDARQDGPIGFWRLIVLDLVRSAALQRLDTFRACARQPSTRWLATCALGLGATVLAAHAMAGAFRYFYHPYFEGVVVPAWAYGVCLGLVLGGAVGAGQWLLLPPARLRASSWALASAVALPVAAMFSSAAVERALVGVNPLAAYPHPDLLGLVLGLDRARDWTELTLQFTAMAASGILVRATIVRAVAEPRHAH